MQALDPAGVYTDAEVIDALTGRLGTRQLTYRYDRLDSSNNYIEPIDWVIEGKVSNNALADIKRRASFALLDRTPINYLRDRIQPWATLAMPDGGVVEWPLGVFLPVTPERAARRKIIDRQVEAFDQLSVLIDDKVTDRYSIAAGVAYTTAIATLVASFTYAITPSALTLPAAMDWEPGTTKLRILNDLLGAINYESAWFDERGRLICRPYLSPAGRAPEYVYDTASTSGMVSSDDIVQGLDLFAVPNKWVLVKSEADQPSITGTYTNTNPASPTSTVSRGRTIVDFRTEQDAADQTTIDAKAARLGFEASQVFENVSFSTPAMPMHSNADVLELRMPELALEGKYSEHTWELPLKPGELMTHTVRRVVVV